METPIEPRRTSLMATVEMLAKAFAIVIGVAYAAGFTIITLHHARFGILQFEMFRPRVAAAGVTFLALVLLPIAVALWHFKPWSPEEQKTGSIAWKYGVDACFFGVIC